jgi:hypothetical protein
LWQALHIIRNVAQKGIIMNDHHRKLNAELAEIIKELEQKLGYDKKGYKK